MNWFDDVWVRPESAGVAGALLGLFNAPGETWRLRTFNLGSGVAASWFLAPWVCEVVGITSENGRLALAFLVGLIGMNLVAKIINHVNVSSLADLIDLLRGRSQQPPKD